MADPASLPDSELERAQLLGAATYLSAYIRRMSRALGINEPEAEGEDGVNAMVLMMVEPLNQAVTATWCAMMNDRKGSEAAMERFKAELSELQPDPENL